MTLSRKAPMSRTPMKSQSFKRIANKKAGAVAKVRRKSKPKSTAAEREHLGKVAALGCILCQHLDFGPTPAEVHHVRERHGWGRSGHFATIPLCPSHHRGQPFGIHDMGREQFTARYGISEIELLSIVRIRLGLDFVKPKGESATDCESVAPSDQKNTIGELS